MKSPAETQAGPAVPRARAPFFKREGERSRSAEAQPFFRPPPIQRVEDTALGLSTHHGPLQAKLTVGQPGDQYEQEADHVADQVVRMPEPQVRRQAEEEEESVQAKELSGTPPQIQQMCAECREEAQRQPANEEEGAVLQPKAVPGRAPRVSPGVESQVRALRGGGRPLSPPVRTFMESRFGRDFGHIRLHTDSRAAASARSLKARAYTIRNNVVMGAGAYVPHTTAGRRLLAHELTHTVQQGAAGPALRKTPQDTPQLQKTPIAGRSFAKADLRVQRQEDLRSSRFSGNRTLERAFDGATQVDQQSNRSGAHVTLIQDSLLAQGYTLPLFGADGIYGSETEGEVRKFQVDVGAVKLDGIVGPETMRLLDMHDPGGSTGVAPGGGGGGGGAAPAAPTGAVFSEAATETFAGYDASVAPNWLVVGINERRRANVAMAPAGAVATFVSDTPGVATVVPTNTGITVTGVTAGTARIEARDGPGAGATVLDTLRVSVKNQLDRSVAFHYVCDSRTVAAGGPHCSSGSPSPDEMRSLLNRVWHRQANIRFTGGVRHDIVVPGDMGASVDWNSALPGGGEWQTVTNMGAGADYNVFRVWRYMQDGNWPNDAANLGNNTLIGDNPCADGWGLAHECGHFLGVGHANGFIMTPCGGRVNQRVSKAMADVVNP